ncbi:MAG: alpha/beta hydrolase [Burkholderiales bacterium]|jgi:arylformamidase|nr:alpha/beta hydrolase [Burkholderiales bacterium]
MKKDAAWWDARYNNRAAVPEHPQIFARWAHDSAAARKKLRPCLDVPYGEHPMEKLDIFPAQGESRALLCFVHGGYWRSLDKGDFSFLAPALAKRGVTVVMTNYALCPAVKVEDIVRQQLQACAWLWRNGRHFGAPRGNLYLAGHSAGGQLVAMMMSAIWPLVAPDLPAKVVSGGLAISGLYDLTELLHVPSINGDLHLDAAEARKVSPIFYDPATDAPLYLAVGSKELPPFVEQNAAFAAHWKKVLAADIACPGDDHFTVLDRLAQTDSALFKGAMRMMGLA